MTVIQCVRCGTSVETERSTRKYCSKDCERKQRTGYPKTRACRHCETPFQVLGRADANRWHCSKQCAKTHAAKTVKEWQQDNPELMAQYGKKWADRNPGYFTEVKRASRLKILALLGGRCVVCGVDNPSWLHVDFIPGSRGLQYRHSRGIRYITENLELFRILCANHHYELTLTGRIDGTEITQ